jgi:hypothetical protein
MQDTVLYRWYGITGRMEEMGECRIDQRMVAVQRLLWVPTPLILILIITVVCGRHILSRHQYECLIFVAQRVHILVQYSTAQHNYYSLNIRSYLRICYIKLYHKKAVPQPTNGGAGRERRYSSYSFRTLELDGGEWSVSDPGHPSPLGEGPPVPIVQQTGWDPEPVWTQCLEEKIFLPLPGIKPQPSSP